VTPAFERIVEANTLLSGLGFESSAGIAHSFTRPDGSGANPRVLPREKVAIGTLAGLHMTDADPKEMATVYDSVSLSDCNHVADIGLVGVTRRIF